MPTRKKKKNTNAVQKMRKGEFINALAEKAGISKTDVKDFMEHLFGLTVSEVNRAGELTLPNFGKVVKKDRPARMARNPRTGEQVKVGPKTTLKFRIAKALKVGILGDPKATAPRKTKKKSKSKRKAAGKKS